MYKNMLIKIVRKVIYGVDISKKLMLVMVGSISSI